MADPTDADPAAGFPRSDHAPPSEPILGAVLCGGRSSRFGSDKALAPFRGSTVGERLVGALRGAGVDPIVAIGGRAGDQLGLPTVPDRRPGDGPLGGLATALLYARTGRVLVVPCDLPLLSTEHIARLLADVEGPGGPVVATVGGQPKISLSVWPTDEGRRILRLVDGGERRFRAALDGTDWHGVEVPEAAVTDADTPAELAKMENDAN